MSRDQRALPAGHSWQSRHAPIFRNVLWGWFAIDLTSRGPRRRHDDHQPWIVARASLVRNCVTGRNELGNVVPLFRAEPVFTRYRGGQLDVDAVERQLDRWFATAGLEFSDITGGGALITGLAAQSSNAPELTQLFKSRFQNAVVARADDPCLESWLAFMGNTLELSRAEPALAFLNLDIGGGTTNLACGLAGEVMRCGCYYVGARHIEVEPGTYRLKSLSVYGDALLTELGVTVKPGLDLTPSTVEEVLDFYVGLLESAVTARPIAGNSKLAQLHCQAEFVPPQRSAVGAAEPVVTLSGGVGELAYRHVRGEPLPGTTAFGDLGIDLAKRICQSPFLGNYHRTHGPSGLGRATVQGLTIHSTEISGSTLYLPDPKILPLIDLPILGTIGPATNADDLTALDGPGTRSARGACLRVQFETEDAASVKAFWASALVGRVLDQAFLLRKQPLVLLVTGNIGKTLGQYATRWGQADLPLVVIDEVSPRPAHFATIGAPHNGLIPVSFHGLESRLD